LELFLYLNLSLSLKINSGFKTAFSTTDGHLLNRTNS